ncbi:MAG TPA: AbrB/MazE/SpoVT family DNA-binding domain-containing protein [Nitrososphaera sp.]|jgi:bifunctional DNA-binding transcriptional regulator/antitoxin component of YhaV-PrlF toxin-antitoxin module
MAFEKPLEVKVRKIGTSYGVIIPKEVLDSINAKEDDTLLIRLEKAYIPKDIKGWVPGLKFEREHGRDRF